MPHSSTMQYIRLPSQLRLAILSLFAVASATNLQLTSVQPIVGFSTPCFTAYSQLLPSCSLEDLVAAVGGRNGGCSVSCMADLTSAQADVQASCQGERASRQTVIGQMFLGTVVDFLCSNDAAGAPQSASQGISTSMTAAITTMSTAAPVGTGTTASSSSSSSSSVSSASSTPTEGSSASSESSTSTQTEQTSTSTTAASTGTQGANSNNRGNGEDGTATTFNGAGGGSPFDGGPGEFDGAGGRLSLGNSPLHLLGTFTAILLLLR